MNLSAIFPEGPSLSDSEAQICHAFGLGRVPLGNTAAALESRHQSRIGKVRA